MIYLSRRGKRAAFLLGAAGLVLVIALVRDYWYPAVGFLLTFVGANDRVISGLDSLLGIAIWPIDLILAVAGLRELRRANQRGSEINAHQTVQHQGQNLIACRDINQQITHHNYGPQSHHTNGHESGNADSSRALLPPMPNLLEGRHEDLVHLKAALGISPSSAEAGDTVAQKQTTVCTSHLQSRVVAVHGWPGIGKSAMVARLCHDPQVLEHFGGRVYFLPLGPSPSTRHVAEQFCNALGLRVPSQASVQDLQSMLAGALSQECALLVLDDVWERSDAAPLLVGGNGCATLVTSRKLDLANQLATAPEGAIKLDLLSEEDSLTLLRRRAPEIVETHTDHCLSLVRAMDGLPLALKVAADLLRVESRSGFDVTSLLEEMTEAARVLREEAPHDVQHGDSDGQAQSLITVRALLRKSVERMDEVSIKRFAELGILPSKPLSFDPWAAEEVWRETAEDPEPDDSLTEEEQDRIRKEEHSRSRNAIGELVKRGLVEAVETEVDPAAVKLDLHSARPERFWMHSLVAAFALDTLQDRYGEEAVRNAHKRRLEHYRRVVAAADGAMHQGSDSQYFAAFLLPQDLPNVRAAHGWARARSDEDRYCREYLSRLLNQGSWMLAERLGPSEFLDWIRLAEDAAQDVGDMQALNDHMTNRVAALLWNGRTEEAAAHCAQVLDRSPGREDTLEEASALTNFAVIYRRYKDYRTALDCAQRGEQAARKADSPNTAAGAMGEQAQCLKRLDEIESAEERLEVKRDFSWDTGELSRYAEALTELAIIRRERPAQIDAARGYFEAAAEIFFDLKQYVDYRRAQIGLGVLEVEAEELDEAEAAFDRALCSALDSDDKIEQARARMHLGIVYWYRNTNEGIEAAETAFREARNLNNYADAELQGDILLNLALLIRDYEQETREACELAQEAEGIYEDSGSNKISIAQQVLGTL